MSRVTLDVVISGKREALFRMRLGGWLLKLGARIMGCGIEIGNEPTDADVIRYHPIGGGPEQFIIGRRVRRQDG